MTTGAFRNVGPPSGGLGASRRAQNGRNNLRPYRALNGAHFLHIAILTKATAVRILAGACPRGHDRTIDGAVSGHRS